MSEPSSAFERGKKAIQNSFVLPEDLLPGQEVSYENGLIQGIIDKPQFLAKILESVSIIEAEKEQLQPYQGSV